MSNQKEQGPQEYQLQQKYQGDVIKTVGEITEFTAKNIQE